MKRLNRKGSVLISVVGLVLLIFIILSIVLSIASSYQKRAINEHARKQAYLNGVSVAETIAGQIYSANSSFIPTANNTITLSDIALPMGYSGEVSVIIKYDSTNDSILYIQVTSVYNKQTEKMQLAMKKKDDIWYKTVYSKIGDVINEKS